MKCFNASHWLQSWCSGKNSYAYKSHTAVKYKEFWADTLYSQLSSKLYFLNIKEKTLASRAAPLKISVLAINIFTEGRSRAFFIDQEAIEWLKTEAEIKEELKQAVTFVSGIWKDTCSK